MAQDLPLGAVTAAESSCRPWTLWRAVVVSAAAETRWPEPTAETSLASNAFEPAGETSQVSSQWPSCDSLGSTAALPKMR